MDRARTPSMMQWSPMMDSRWPRWFTDYLPAASRTTGINMDARIFAASNYPFNVFMPQMGSSPNFLNGMGVVSPMRPHAPMNSIQQESRNEINFLSANRNGDMDMSFAVWSRQRNLAIPEMRVNQGLINAGCGVGAENQTRLFRPWLQEADNPILIEIQKARQNQRYRDDENPVKPLYSIVTLIAMAIENDPAKIVSVGEIYQFIIDLFPFYRHNSKKWQSTVCNTLTSEDCFIKNDRLEGYLGTGKVWSLHPDSIKSFEYGQMRRKKVSKNKTKAKRPRMDPTLGAHSSVHQIRFLGMGNKPYKTETKIQDPGMTLPVVIPVTVPVNVGHSGQHHQIDARAPETPRFLSSTVWPVQTVASFRQYSAPHTATHTNGYPFPRQHNQVETDNQLHNHNGSGGCNEFRLRWADNNEHRFHKQIPYGENYPTHSSTTALTQSCPNFNYTNNIHNTSSTSSAIAGPTVNETWDPNNPSNPLSGLPSMSTANTDHTSENADQQRYTEPLSQLTKLLGYTDQWFEDILESRL